MPVTIQPVESSSDLEDLRVLFRAYAAELQEPLCLGAFEDEIASLPQPYAPPAGGLWLASVAGENIGCAALRSLNDETAEVKRLFVRPGFRRAGAGRLLLERVVAEGKARRYKIMVLETLVSMGPARALYRETGFQAGAQKGSIMSFRLNLA